MGFRELKDQQREADETQRVKIIRERQKEICRADRFAERQREADEIQRVKRLVERGRKRFGELTDFQRGRERQMRYRELKDQQREAERDLEN